MDSLDAAVGRGRSYDQDKFQDVKAREHPRSTRLANKAEDLSVDESEAKARDNADARP